MHTSLLKEFRSVSEIKVEILKMMKRVMGMLKTLMGMTL